MMLKTKNLVILFLLLFIIASSTAIHFYQTAKTFSSENTVLKSALAIAGKQTTLAQRNIREIIPHGYVINNSFFYSPDLGMSFHGNLEKLTFQNNVFRADGWPGEIELIKKDKNTDVETAIKQLIAKEGKDPKNCDIQVEYADTVATATVLPKNEKKPTEQEIFTFIKSDRDIKTITDYRKICKADFLNCAYDADALITNHREELCSKYAQPQIFKQARYFQVTSEGDGNNYFIFINTENGNGDAPWMQYVNLYSASS